MMSLAAMNSQTLEVSALLVPRSYPACRFLLTVSPLR